MATQTYREELATLTKVENVLNEMDSTDMLAAAYTMMASVARAMARVRFSFRDVQRYNTTMRRLDGIRTDAGLSHPDIVRIQARLERTEMQAAEARVVSSPAQFRIVPIGSSPGARAAAAAHARAAMPAPMQGPRAAHASQLENDSRAFNPYRAVNPYALSPSPWGRPADPWADDPSLVAPRAGPEGGRGGAPPPPVERDADGELWAVMPNGRRVSVDDYLPPDVPIQAVTDMFPAEDMRYDVLQGPALAAAALGRLAPPPRVEEPLGTTRDDTCIVCLERRITAKAEGCGHKYFCVTCVRAVAAAHLSYLESNPEAVLRCPYCNQPTPRFVAVRGRPGRAARARTPAPRAAVTDISD